jgi:hypothetical protein
MCRGHVGALNHAVQVGEQFNASGFPLLTAVLHNGIRNRSPGVITLRFKSVEARQRTPQKAHALSYAVCSGASTK